MGGLLCCCCCCSCAMAQLASAPYSVGHARLTPLLPCLPLPSALLPRGELEEVLRYVKPQHFLPVHGEYAFLTAHAQVSVVPWGCCAAHEGGALGMLCCS